jgi:hypothetical protein
VVRFLCHNLSGTHQSSGDVVFGSLMEGVHHTTKDRRAIVCAYAVDKKRTMLG